MDIITLLSILGSLASIEAEVRNGFKYLKEKKEKFPSIERSNIASDLERCANDVDRFLVSRYNSVFSTEERNDVKKEFYKLYPDLQSMCDYVDPLIDSYLEQLETFLYKRMSIGERVIKKQVDDLGSDISDCFNSIDETSGKIIHEFKIASEKFDSLFQNSEKSEYLKKYYEKKRHEFEDVPKESTVVGDLSIEQAYIDIEVNKNYPGGNRASEYIIRRCRQYDCGAHLLYGQPGHGKTTLGLKLVHDYIVGNVDFKVFCFPLVSPFYDMIDGDVIRIYDVLRLDKYDSKSRLDDKLIENSLIILDGYDELQATLTSDNPYADPVYFFDKINQFAIEKKAYILITTRSITIDSLPKEKKKQLSSIGDLISMKPMAEEDQYEWIKKHKQSYLPSFQHLRQTYLSIHKPTESKPSNEDIFGIPFIFFMTVAAEFDDEADNLVQLYDKLFESTLLRRNPVISADEIKYEKEKYERLALDMLPNNGKFTMRSSCADKQDYSLYTYSYYMKVVHMKDVECVSNEINRFIEFYHRTFYEYFLAYSLYNWFNNTTEEDIDDFLYSLGAGNLDFYILKYIRQIIRNRGKRVYNEIVQKRIEETDALIVRNDENPLLRCNQIFTNALMLMNIFADGLSIHEATQMDFSSYEDTKLCQLLRQYKCTQIDLSGCKMVGAHIDRADLRRSDFIGANMSGKTDMSFSTIATCNFSFANMNSIDMYRTVLDSSIFVSTDMSNGRFEEGSFKKAKFTGTDMRGSNFIRTNFSNTKLMDVKVDEKTDFTNAKLDGLVTNVDLSCCIPEFHNLVEKGIIRYEATEI